MLTKDDKSLLKRFAEKLLLLVNNENYPRCELLMENTEIGATRVPSLYLLTDRVLPSNYTVTVYRYVNRRQKHTKPETQSSGNIKTHTRVKGWRFAGFLLVNSSSPSTNQGETTTPSSIPFFKYRYKLLGNNNQSLLQQAISCYNETRIYKRANYFRQRLAIEIGDENYNPLTPKMEFMMDFTKNESTGLATKAWFCRVHQYTATPSGSGVTDDAVEEEMPE